MIKLKDYMTELEMEQYLSGNDYKIFDDEGCTDSTLVIENANSIGYESRFDDNEEFLEFRRI